MNMADNILYRNESYNIIGAAMEVHNTIGCGFTEPVYQDALEKEFILRNIPYHREKEIPIFYKGEPLDKTFRVDFLCYNAIIVELKAVTDFTEAHYAQVYNYLKAGNFSLGILINFSKTKLIYERIPCTVKWKAHEQ